MMFLQGLGPKISRPTEHMERLEQMEKLFQGTFELPDTLFDEYVTHQWLY